MTGDEPTLWQPPRWLPPVLLVAAGAAMLAFNFDGWMHPIVDYGRELYVPWRLAEGEVLYRDIAYFNGPLSPYLDASVFAVFGTHMRALLLADAAVAAAACALLYDLVRRVADRYAATVAGLVFVLLFVFQHVDVLGNFNWMAPYSHEMTHGLVLGLAATWCVCRHAETPRRLLLLGAGTALGLAFLTKPEVFAAAALACAVGVLARAAAGAVAWRRAAADLGLVAGAGLVPPVLATALLAAALPLAAAVRGALGGWVYLSNAQLTSLAYYAVGRGTDRPWHSLGSMALGLAAFGVVLVPAALLARRGPPASAALRGLPVVLPGALLALSLESTLGLRVDWEGAFSPLLLFVGLAVLTSARAVRRRGDAPAIGALVLGVLGLGLFAKIVLNVRIHHYGFGLSAVGTAVAIAALLSWVPRALRRQGGDAEGFRSAGLGLVAAVVAGCLVVSCGNIRGKTYTTGSASEPFRSAPTAFAEELREATKWLLERTPPDATVLVLPEGVTINYFTRRRNPTGHINFMPPEVLMFGEDAMLRAVQGSPPDYCVVVQRSSGEYGLPLFGTHYGAKILDWVGQHYVPVVRFGEQPLVPARLKDNKAGMFILRRRGG